MRTYTKIIARTIVLAAAGWFAGCNYPLDEEPNVVLEVESLTIPPVTASNVGGCLLTVSNASIQLHNKPKNHLSSTSEYPFNDVVLDSLHVDYVWDDGVGIAAADFGIGGTIPAGGTGSVICTVVNLRDLGVVAPDNRDGHTAALTLTIRGTTVAGEAVSVKTGGSLNINSCPPAP
jgi:hypothetical protein